MSESDISFSEQDLEYLRETKILIATPAYGEQVSVYYARSMMQLFSFAAKYQLPISFITVGNESLVTRARNSLVHDFMESGADRLMFIDSDISFDPMDVLQLALHRQDVVAGAYPVKGLSWERAVKKKTAIEVREATINYVINVPDDVAATEKNDKISVELKNGLLEVLDAGTGFMMISRYAIDMLIKAYGTDMQYKTERSVVGKDGLVKKETGTYYAIFDTSIEPETERYLSEDFTFCRRWQNIGGQVWVDPSIVLDHHGSYTYRGYPIC